jgi:hypothetical protein
MSRGLAYRRAQEERARARCRRIVRLWSSDPDPTSRYNDPDAYPAWFGVVVSTHGRACSGACCFGSHFRVFWPATRRDQQADVTWSEYLADVD